MLRMRFGREMTHLQIAHVLGRSQMQISRALARSLARLRRLADSEALLAD